MGLPDGAYPETPIFDAVYWDWVAREAEAMRKNYVSMDPCPVCFHIFCECP